MREVLWAGLLGAIPSAVVGCLVWKWQRKITRRDEARDKAEAEREAAREEKEKAREELGWEAQYGVKEMCEDSWRWQKMNPNGYGE